MASINKCEGLRCAVFIRCVRGNLFVFHVLWTWLFCVDAAVGLLTADIPIYQISIGMAVSSGGTVLL